MRLKTFLIAVLLACTWASASRASDYIDPERQKCQVLVDRMMAAQQQVMARAKAAGPRERQCAVLRRDVPASLERVVRAVESEPSCRAKLGQWVFDTSRARIETVRQRVAKLCGARV
jgi:hypothetical protein